MVAGVVGKKDIVDNNSVGTMEEDCSKSVVTVAPEKKPKGVIRLLIERIKRTFS